MSDEGGFPHTDGMNPYVSCLPVLEQCPLVIGVIDRAYGAKFSDWSPYAQLNGCSPTHAELRHALDLKKKVLIYIQDDIWNFYEVWRKNKSAFGAAAPRGLDVNTLEMIAEFKKRAIIPWMAHFSDVASLQNSLAKEFANQLHSYLVDNENLATDTAGYIIEKVKRSSPDVRAQIIDAIVSMGSVAGFTSAHTLDAIKEAKDSPTIRPEVLKMISMMLIQILIALLSGAGASYFPLVIRMMTFIR